MTEDYKPGAGTHPITPPPELVELWYRASEHANEKALQDVATQAARWGADQELEACCEWLGPLGIKGGDALRAARRPKPPSLKEQALKALQDQIDTAFMLSPEAEERADLIRRALEQLDD